MRSFDYELCGYTRSNLVKLDILLNGGLFFRTPKNRQDSITSYSLTERNIIGNVKEPIQNYDLMTAVMICLGSGGKGNNVLRLLETLLSAKIEPEEKKQILQNDLILK